MSYERLRSGEDHHGFVVVPLGSEVAPRQGSIASST
jgi:hypothetical protein